MIWYMHVTYSINLATPGQWNASMLGTPYRENWPKAVWRRQFNGEFIGKNTWTMEIILHPSQLSHYVSLFVESVCVAIFLLNEFVDNWGGLAELNALVADLASLKSCSTCTDWALDGLAPLFRGAFLSTCPRNKSGTSIPTLQKMTKNPRPGYHMLPLRYVLGVHFSASGPWVAHGGGVAPTGWAFTLWPRPYLSSDTTIYDYMT